MRHFTRAFLTTALLLCATAASLPARNVRTGEAAQYYVSPRGNDSNPGTAARPWATIQHAAYLVRRGDTIHVAAGTYPGAITTRISGTATARIRFVSDAKWGAKIRSVGAGSVWENRGDYVDIEGFDISGDGRIGIMNLGSHVRIIGNHVHEVPAAGCTSLGGAGIDNGEYKSVDNDIIGNVVHDIGDLHASQPCYRVHGIYHSNPGGHIWNNIAYRNQGFGIHLWHFPRNVVVANNLVYENQAGGIILGSDPKDHFVADEILVANNIVIHNKGISIKELGLTGAENRFANNLVYGNGKDALMVQHGRASGTITADPQLVDFRPDGTGDYHLKPSSPALGCAAEGGPPEDFSGVKRPRAKGSLGPFESAGGTRAAR